MKQHKKMGKYINRITRLWLIIAFLFWILACVGIATLAILGNRHQEHIQQVF